jgi:hypothetical protein
VLAILVALVAILVARATWRPSAPFRLARRRASGQILAAAAHMYRGHLGLFVGIGSVLLPLSLIDALLQTLVLRASSIAGIDAQGEGEGVLVLFVVALGTALTLVGVALVQAATVRALVELDAGRTVNPVRAYRLAVENVWSMLGALVAAVVVVSFLASTIILLPVAIALAVRWALIAPVTALEDRSASGALRRSGRLVGRNWLKVACLTILSFAIVLVAGPLVGTVLVILTSASLGLLNLVAGVLYAVLLPFVALTTAYVYFDVRVRRELDDCTEREREVLDAESELAR